MGTADDVGMEIKMIKEEYQKEISQIHAPKQLLEETRRAMKEEEKRLAQQRKGKKVFLFKRVLPAVAAAVLVLSASAAVIYFKGDETSMEQEIPVQLGGKQAPEIGKIGKSTEAESAIRKMSERPETFRETAGALMEEEFKEALERKIEELNEG